ncbi:uncharacterized protein LOC126821405 [Patella vulgata]|uniref:uncharacterized protein LOC126821405 n=1 Tax=Patella vulgata TaxID=6465 RepID=UPI00217F628B|nr:uncharacterized protein LOC126821405 [Patella vulgata]XP_050405784.1 uncharacterized protein LOC126821405 [Patella vulgata]
MCSSINSNKTVTNTRPSVSQTVDDTKLNTVTTESTTKAVLDTVRTEMCNFQKQSLSELKQFILDSLKSDDLRQSNVGRSCKQGQGCDVYDSENSRQDELKTRRKRKHERREIFKNVVSYSDLDEDDIIPSAQHVRHDNDNDDVIDQIDDLLADDNSVKGDNLEVNKDETESFETVLEQEYTIKEVVGANLNPKLISIVNQLFVKVLPEEKLKEMTEKYPKPANTEVNMPLVNKEIWSVLKTNTKTTDLKSQKIQNKVVKTSYSLAELIAFLMELKKKAKCSPDDMSKAIRMAMDSMTMLAQANRELNQKRKDTLRPDLSYPSKLLCNPPTGDVENSVFLFGEELGKKVKELKEANSVYSLQPQGLLLRINIEITIIIIGTSLTKEVLRVTQIMESLFCPRASGKRAKQDIRNLGKAATTKTKTYM